MVKAVIFTHGFENVTLEFETIENAFDLIHENTWGLTKTECGWDFERHNGFLTECFCPSDKYRKTLIKTGLPDEAIKENKKDSKGTYYGGRKWCFSETTFLLIHNEKPIEDSTDKEFEVRALYGNDEDLRERVNSYMKSLTREIKIDSLGID
jgi:hypothetical protein